MTAKNALCLFLIVACLACLSSCGPLDPAEQLELEGTGEVFVVKVYCTETEWIDHPVYCNAREKRPPDAGCLASDAFGTIRRCDIGPTDAGILP